MPNALRCLLFCQGKWDGAERELRTALRIGKNAEPALYGETLANLAELRVVQGRLGEAEELLRGFEDHVAATSRERGFTCGGGEAAVAAVLLRRRLESFGQECVETGPAGWRRAASEPDAR